VLVVIFVVAILIFAMFLLILGIVLRWVLVARSPGAIGARNGIRRSHRTTIDRRDNNGRTAGRSHGSRVDGRTVVPLVMRLRAEKMGIPHPVSTVIFRMPPIKIAVMTHAMLYDENARKDDFLTIARGDCDRTAIGYRIAVIRIRKNAARCKASDCGGREKLNFHSHKLSRLLILRPEASVFARC